MTCELCERPGGEIIWQDVHCRVVLVDDVDYPGFCRVIWQQHVREMTDLSEANRAHLMTVVFAVESAVRDIMHPDKINLASLGNLTPHLHWHVIPRFADDKHFPGAIWAPALRDSPTKNPALVNKLDELRAALRARLCGDVAALRDT